MDGGLQNMDATDTEVRELLAALKVKVNNCKASCIHGSKLCLFVLVILIVLISRISRRRQYKYCCVIVIIITMSKLLLKQKTPTINLYLSLIHISEPTRPY